MATFIITAPDGELPADPWDILVAVRPDLARDCVYAPPPDIHTGDRSTQHSRTGITVRRLA